jgi:hypothetical protein
MPLGRDAGELALDRQDLREVAVSSASAVFTEVIESGFDLPHVHAYDVQSAVFVMDRLAAGTGQQRYRELAQKARSWFDGRNPGSGGHIRPRDWPSRGRT